jgi:predicted Abi (CAAX) family protease
VTDLRDALLTVPDARTWFACAGVFALFVACAGPIGLLSGLLRPTVPHVMTRDVVMTAALVFVHPAFVEEVIFRGLLLPRDVRALPRRRVVMGAVVALALYVASHPLNAILFRPSVLQLFANPVYLVLATLLGIACTIAYLVSRSIWPAVAIHWVSVVTWIWLLGGREMLGRS